MKLRIAARLVVCALSGVAMPAFGTSIYALTGASTLIRFDSNTPGTIDRSLAVLGLPVGEGLFGIAFRPANGQLLALGSFNRLYRIDIGSGAATQVGADGAFTLSGSHFGVDVNPAVDRVRIVSDADQSLRLNPDTGTIVGTDSTLAYATGDMHNGANPNVVAVAYSNSRAGSAVTTLYDIDSTLDLLAIQNPPNGGTLNTIGALGVPIGADVGFDIFSPIGGADVAYAALNVSGGGSGLYTVNLAGGGISFVGAIGPGAVLIRALAVPLDQIFAARFE